MPEKAEVRHTLSTLSNILLTPFDREMRLRGYQLTRFADDCAPRARKAGRLSSA
jgi:hypothetical protein